MFYLSFSLRTNTPSKKENITATGSFSLPYHIDIEKGLNNIEPFTLSNIGKELEYIPLETSPKSLLRKIYEMTITDSYIFISDFDKLLQFDRKGNFIRQVGSNGKGPGEYINVMGFCIDESNEVIYLIARDTGKVLKYSFQGKYMGQIDVLITIHGAFQLLKYGSDSLVFLAGDDTYTEESENISVIDTTGKTLYAIKSSFRKMPGTLGMADFPMYSYNEKITLLEDGSDTLKTFEQGGLKPYGILNMGKMKFDPNTPIPNSKNWISELRNLTKDKLLLLDIKENQQYLFIRLNYGLSDSTINGIFNKRSSETFFLENDGFENDLDGGLPFWPRTVYRDSILIQTVEAYKLITHIRNTNYAKLKSTYGEKFIRLEKMANTLDETSNPVLIILKLG